MPRRVFKYQWIVSMAGQTAPFCWAGCLAIQEGSTLMLRTESPTSSMKFLWIDRLTYLVQKILLIAPHEGCFLPNWKNMICGGKDHTGYYLDHLLGQNNLTYLSKLSMKKRVVSLDHCSVQATNLCFDHFSSFNRVKRVTAPFHQHLSFNSYELMFIFTWQSQNRTTGYLLFNMSTFLTTLSCWKEMNPFPKKVVYFHFVPSWMKLNCCMLLISDIWTRGLDSWTGLWTLDFWLTRW